MAVLRATILPYFNPLRREGGDWCFIFPLRQWPDFNPLRREGGDDRAVQYFPRETLDFNPLRREGGDTARSVQRESTS